MKSPVLCIIFNRPDTTKRVFEAVRAAKPAQLFICAEGPRKNRPNDISLCEQARAIYDNIDWDCEVHRLYRETNSGGCGPGVSGAITWFFEHVEEGIILEDDIVPHPEFFSFCDEMLERYRNESRIKCICGYNIFYDGVSDYPYSYYFSHYMFVWGWATWKRTWKEYDYSLKSIERKTLAASLKKMPIEKGNRRMALSVYDKMTSDNPIDTWDYQLSISIQSMGGLTVVPITNLCENIGFAHEEATHTTAENSQVMQHKSAPIYPLSHPNRIQTDERLEKMSWSMFYLPTTSPAKQFTYKAKRLVYRLLHGEF